MYSVAVPAFNEADRIGNLLSFLSPEAPLQPAEIIVCDSLSSDDTAAVVRRWQKRIPSLRYIEADRPGKAAAWNCLMRAARSPLVIFIDADVSPAPECLTKLLSAARRSDHLIYGCRRRVRPPADTLASHFLRLLADPVIELCLVGGCYAVRKEPVFAPPSQRLHGDARRFRGGYLAAGVFSPGGAAHPARLCD